ncbi:hypothetical protein ACHAXR_007277 [Thalassiosira sp. AJA248-18]
MTTSAYERTSNPWICPRPATVAEPTWQLITPCRAKLAGLSISDMMMLVVNLSGFQCAPSLVARYRTNLIFMRLRSSNSPRSNRSSQRMEMERRPLPTRMKGVAMLGSMASGAAAAAQSLMFASLIPPAAPTGTPTPSSSSNDKRRRKRTSIGMLALNVAWIFAL